MEKVPVIAARATPTYERRAIIYTPRPAINRPKKPKMRKRKMALLLPAHNEELIIATTIRSAMAAGQAKQDIFVVDDNSSDNTRAEALKLLPKDQVLTVRRSGKALAVRKAIKKFRIISRYQWLHVADADSIFSPNYFRVYRRKLNGKKYAVAVGFVQSMRGNWISTYRALTYTYSQQVNRRVQSYLGMVSVFPGPITSFRTDIINKLDFDTNSLTEDFDITLQVHRKHLGKIRYIPGAVNYTQDPQSLGDFTKQNLRWQRGFFQGVKKYKIGLRPGKIDVSIGYQLFQTVFFLVELFVIMPLIIVRTGRWQVIPFVLAADFVVNGVTAIFSSIAAKRWNLLGALPYFFFLRWLEIGVFLMAFVEVMILGRFKTSNKGWDTEGRRYKLSLDALKDVKTA
jgi:biofilm PGA synthesis N-glycosyltransferase PgaC